MKNNTNLKEFIENSSENIQVYCTNCINGENLIKSVVEDCKNLEPKDCKNCYPFDFEDSVSLKLRKNYKEMKNKERLTLEEYNQLRDISMKLIEKYHKDDVDKGGHPYIGHLTRVSNGCKTYESSIAGLLHDIIEDTPCTENILLESGIPQYIIDIVLLVSRKDEESYEEFIDRLISSGNKHAMELKCSDLKDNCDLSRLKGLSDEVIKKGEKRVKNRYIPSLLKIEKALMSLK